jgi:hypothetical protein
MNMKKTIALTATTLLFAAALGCNQIGVTHTYMCWLRNVHRQCDGSPIPDFTDSDETVSAKAACNGLRAKWIGYGALPSITCDPNECVEATPVVRDWQDDPPAPEPQPQTLPPDPTDLCCGSSCSTGTTTTCGAPSGDACQACASQYCCDSWSACQGDANCQCLIACEAAGNDLAACEQDPGADPSVPSCGPRDFPAGQLDGCLLTSCAVACGATMPAPPPDPEVVPALRSALGRLE